MIDSTRLALDSTISASAWRVVMISSARGSCSTTRGVPHGEITDLGDVFALYILGVP
jgi:hypothetical protein